MLKEPFVNKQNVLLMFISFFLLQGKKKEMNQRKKNMRLNKPSQQKLRFRTFLF